MSKLAVVSKRAISFHKNIWASDTLLCWCYNQILSNLASIDHVIFVMSKLAVVSKRAISFHKNIWASDTLLCWCYNQILSNLASISLWQRHSLRVSRGIHFLEVWLSRVQFSRWILCRPIGLERIF